MLRTFVASFVLLFFQICSIRSNPNSIKECQKNDFKYDFTECDSFGGRWRVSVPKSPGECIAKDSPVNSTLRVDKCFTSCENGQFFNITTLLCENCQAGHFSLGGGIVMHSFNNSGHLPDGFHIITESTKLPKETDKKCNGWLVDPRSHSLVSSMQNLKTNADNDDAGDSNGCVSVVTYIAKVVKGGKLSFVYRYQLPEDLSSSLLFTFHYKIYSNDDLNSLDFESNSNIRFPSPTVDQTFEVIDVLLRKPGFYIFTWKSVLLGNVNNIFNVNHNNVNFGEDTDANNEEGNKYLFGNSAIGLIQIKKISIEGIAYASECTPCGPGSYASSTGMAECLPCPQNTAIAGYGATKCLPCNSLTEYAQSGSENCQKRPVCGAHDVYSVPQGECDPATKKQALVYHWIEPRVCVDTNNVITSLESSIECTQSSSHSPDQCDLGMALKLEPIGKFCRLCERDDYRDDKSSQCRRCPPFTTPYYAVLVTLWNNTLPAWSNFHLNSSPNALLSEDYFSDNVNYMNAYFSRQCIRSNEDGLAGYYGDSAIINYDDCDSRIAWQPFHNHIRTGASAILDSYLILSLTVPGFRSPNGGEISFVFETHCDHGDKCSLMFVQTNNNDNDEPGVDFGMKSYSSKASKKKLSSLSHQSMDVVIKEWFQSSEERLSYRYRIERNMSVTLSWLFKRKHSFQSHAKIYSVLLTNSMIDSATRCEECAVINRTTSNCVTCAKGQYLVKSNDSSSASKYHCESCPANHIVNPDLPMPVDINSCIACPENMITHNITNVCYSDCHVRFADQEYDLTELPQPLHYQSGSLFTTGGSQYMHLYRLSLCGKPQSMLSTCLNNITSLEDELSRSSGVRSFICRSTIIPDGKQVYATQSVSLGDQLIGISKNTSFNNITVHEEFVKSDPNGRDFHLFYTTTKTTVACAKGRTLTITMRCTLTANKKGQTGKTVVRTPRSCPDGTCDGCNFHFIIHTHTAAACRLCRPFSHDYETLAGECREGLQKVHYINPKECVSKWSDNHTDVIDFKLRTCKIMLPQQVRIGIALAITLAVLLLALVFFFWNKNRSLEYKYHKLVESTGENKGGDELSFDNCCAEDQDDNESNNSIAFPAQADKQDEKNTGSVRKANNRLNESQQLFGDSRKMKSLFGKGNRVDEEGYETIHLTASSSSSSNHKYDPLV